MDIPDTDAAYYRMRETQERGRDSSAALDEIRAIHLTLAEKYRMLLLPPNAGEWRTVTVPAVRTPRHSQAITQEASDAFNFNG